MMFEVESSFELTLARILGSQYELPMVERTTTTDEQDSSVHNREDTKNGNVGDIISHFSSYIMPILWRGICRTKQRTFIAISVHHI